VSLFSFFLSRSSGPRHLPSFPTRRSSDLAIVRQRIAGQRGREILLHEERRLPPSVRQLCGRKAVLALTERLRESRQVILHRWYHQKPAGSGEVPPSAHQREVVAERAIPAPPLPRDGPPLTARALPRPCGASLDLHLGLVNRPRRHRPRAGFVLGE